MIALIPPPIISFLLVRFANLEKYRASSFGKYIHKYMTRQMEAVRFAGYAGMAIGAWIHNIWLILIGLLIVLFSWFSGWIFPNNSTQS